MIPPAGEEEELGTGEPRTRGDDPYTENALNSIVG